MKLFECVPNFSEGRRKEVIDAIVGEATAVPGIAFLDLESDPSHNRSVLSLVGNGEAVVEAALRATREAVKRIDLTTHQGEHPRMGAMDVVPFIPFGEATIEEAVALARRFGQAISRELSIPVYYYGKAATRPERAELPKVREGQFEGIRELIQKDPARAPDEGPSRVHPTGGAIAVGARPILVAYNIYLTTPDVAVAKRIAKAVRGRDGGLAGVQALGFEIRERNQAQVSMNMTDISRTPLHRVFEMVGTEAGRYGVGLAESEIVGLVPEDALVEAAEHYLKLNRFDRHLLLERRVRERLASGGSAPPPGPSATPGLAEGNLPTFLAALAARTPTPGGGSASALAGAMGTALVEMVLRFSVPKDTEPTELLPVLAELAELRRRLTEGVDADARSYDAVRAAVAAKKKAPEGEAEKKNYLAALREATRVPLGAGEACARTLELLEANRARVKPLIASDAATARALLQAALVGTLANAEINLASLREAGAPLEGLDARAEKLRGRG